MVKKYRVKSAEVEAIQYNGENLAELQIFACQPITVQLIPGQWLVKSNGIVLPYHDEAFKHKYEPVPDDNKLLLVHEEDAGSGRCYTRGIFLSALRKLIGDSNCYCNNCQILAKEFGYELGVNKEKNHK